MKFAATVAEYINHGATVEAIMNHIRKASRRVIDVAAAKEIMARRGGFSAELASEK